TSLDPDAWAAAFITAAAPHEARAREAEAAGDSETARQHYVHAYAYYHVGRYPRPRSAGKREAYLKGREAFMKAGRHMDPPLQRIEIPFAGRPGEGGAIPGLFRKPRGEEPAPLVITWSGIESFKEDRITDNYTNSGIASL